MTKAKRAQVNILLTVAFVLFWAICIGAVLFGTARTTFAAAEQYPESLSAAFDEAVALHNQTMRFAFVAAGGSGEMSREELIDVTDRMTAENPGSNYSLMDWNGNVYVNGEHVVGWLGLGYIDIAQQEGHAVFYVSNFMEVADSFALILPIEGSNCYLMSAMSVDDFAAMVMERVSAEYAYAVIYNEWGDRVGVDNTTQDDLQLEDQRQGGLQFVAGGRQEFAVQRHGLLWGYDIFVPLEQPRGWFAGVRIPGTETASVFAVLMGGLAVSMVFSLVLLLGTLFYYNKGKNTTSADADPLTGLNTSTGIETAVNNFFRRASMRDYCLIYMDISSFRRFNAMFGHKMGDALLEAVGACVKKNFPIGARTGGDVFVFVAKADADIESDIEAPIVEAIQEALGSQYVQMVTFRFGVYPLLQRRFNFREAADGALMALRHAKAQPKGKAVIYDLAMLKEDRMNKHIEVNMLHALSGGEFKLFIQPKFSAESVVCSGGEALVRWQSEQMGLLSPFQFIPLFERNGFIVEVDFYMLEELLRFQQQNLENGLPMLPISVNQSRVTISMPNYIERIKDLVSRYSVPTEHIEIEITESILTESYDTVLPLIMELREIGFHIDMDDFGKGYSSLNTLRELPVDILKIDKEFLRESDTSQRGRRIIESIINLARALGIETVCEGVETGMQLDFLRESGCDLVQGYYMARPMPSRDYRRLYLEEKDKA